MSLSTPCRLFYCQATRQKADRTVLAPRSNRRVKRQWWLKHHSPRTSWCNELGLAVSLPVGTFWTQPGTRTARGGYPATIRSPRTDPRQPTTTRTKRAERCLRGRLRTLSSSSQTRKPKSRRLRSRIGSSSSLANSRFGHFSSARSGRCTTPTYRPRALCQRSSGLFYKTRKSIQTSSSSLSLWWPRSTVGDMHFFGATPGPGYHSHSMRRATAYTKA